MKRLIISIIAILAIVSTQAASADFFLDRVVDKGPEKARLDRINIGTYRLSTTESRAKYRDSLFFLSKAKSESFKRYADGRMPFYRFNDAMNELEFLSHYLDEYFLNLATFERTGNSFYKELAMESLADSRTSYDRLRAITRAK